jgi:hypothetical protein
MTLLIDLQRACWSGKEESSEELNFVSYYTHNNSVQKFEQEAGRDDDN